MVGEVRGARKVPLPQGSISSVDTSNLTRRNPLLWDTHPDDLPTRRHIKRFKDAVAGACNSSISTPVVGWG